jgi:hypothetical protein
VTSQSRPVLTEGRTMTDAEILIWLLTGALPNGTGNNG